MGGRTDVSGQNENKGKRGADGICVILSVFLKCCLQGDGNTAAIRRREISGKGVKKSMMKSQRVSQE